MAATSGDFELHPSVDAHLPVLVSRSDCEALLEVINNVNQLCHQLCSASIISPQYLAGASVAVLNQFPASGLTLRTVSSLGEKTVVNAALFITLDSCL